MTADFFARQQACGLAATADAYCQLAKAASQRARFGCAASRNEQALFGEPLIIFADASPRQPREASALDLVDEQSMAPLILRRG